MPKISEVNQATKAAIKAIAAAGFKATPQSSERSLFDKSAETISAHDFGAVGDGIADDSSAINAAIAYVAGQGGGEVVLPNKKYLANIVVTGRGVSIRGRNAWASADGGTGIVPADPALPAVQIGDGVTNTSNISITKVSARARAGDKFGLRVFGVNRAYFRDCFFAGYETAGIDITASLSRPTFHIYFDGGSAHCGSFAGANAVRISAGDSFTTSFHFANFDFQFGAAGAQVISLQGAGLVGCISDSWLEGANGKGIGFGEAGQTLRCSNFIIDSDSSDDVLVTLPTNSPLSDYLFGGVTVDGKCSTPGGTGASLTGFSHSRRTALSGAGVIDAIQFADATLGWHERLGTLGSACAISRAGSSMELRASGAVRSIAGFHDIYTTGGGPGVIRFGGEGLPTDSVGAGDPNGVVAATVGSTYRRTDGASGAVLYVKESGAGNTGWVAK